MADEYRWTLFDEVSVLIGGLNHALSEREILFAQIHRALRNPDLTPEEKVGACLAYIDEVTSDIGREPSLDPPFTGREPVLPLLARVLGEDGGGELRDYPPRPT